METLFHRTWWSYDAGEQNLALTGYHYFNLFEAAVWFVFAGLVAIRYAKHRCSRLEPVYSLAFLCFGLTDVQEAWALTSWLIWIKFGNLIALFWLRATIIKRCYPGSKLY